MSLPVRRGRLSAAVVVLIGLSLSTVSCSDDTEERSLCSSFDQFVTSGAAIRATDVDALTAGDAQDLAEAYLQRVTQLQEVADGRYGAELDALEQSIDDLVRTLASTQEDADVTTWEPLVADSLEDASAASLRVEQAIEPSCSPGVTQD